ncbi:MAG: hypothetical protein SV487_06840 [Thermodesulfobacteriota bacterium]|nr:hypothetical protein [Thermodesulfobacteriota bacterium]
MKAKAEKICLDNECAEAWSKMPADVAQYAANFVYCPYCAEELHIQCSACKEALSSKDYKFCPWCGAEFEV